MSEIELYRQKRIVEILEDDMKRLRPDHDVYIITSKKTPGWAQVNIRQYFIANHNALVRWVDDYEVVMKARPDEHPCNFLDSILEENDILSGEGDEVH